jgi:hypothetical protein
MERAGKDGAFYSHLQSFSADICPHRVELPDLLIGDEPLGFILYLVPIFIDMLLLTILHEPEDINEVLFNISAGGYKFLELILCDYDGILLSASTLVHIVFQIDMLVYVLFGQNRSHD